jgi:glycosyltransferase involved in cell wall biosynthesis
MRRQNALKFVPESAKKRFKIKIKVSCAMSQFVEICTKGKTTKPRRKILFFVSADWFFCSHFIERAIAARREGFDVLVLTNVDRHGNKILEAQLRLFHIPMRRRSLNPFAAAIILFRVLHVFYKERPDLIHNVAIKPVLIGSLAARILGCREVVNAVVGGGYAFTSMHLMVRIFRPALVFFMRALMNPLGSRVVFENRDDLLDFVQKRIVRLEDSFLIRGAGVDPIKFKAPEVLNEPPLVILAARLLWDKGIGEFVAAAKFLSQRGVKARFVIVGQRDADNRACIDVATLDAWSNDGAVEFWGFREDIPQILSQASVACLPSYREGLPKFLLESMAASLPCVTTDVPGCREAVRDGNNGFLVPVRNVVALADALATLILNPILCKEMGERGRLRIESEFSLRTVNEKTLSLYREMLAN